MVALMLILLGVSLRFVPHLPNFTPVIAISLFSGMYLNKKYAVWVPLVLMAISDIILGVHDVFLFTWGSIALTALIGIATRRHRGVLPLVGATAISAMLFFFITNFGVWLVGWYPRTSQGLTACFIAAIPFLRPMIVSSFLYAAVMFGAYEAIAARSRMRVAVKN